MYSIKVKHRLIFLIFPLLWGIIGCEFGNKYECNRSLEEDIGCGEVHFFQSFHSCMSFEEFYNELALLTDKGEVKYDGENFNLLIEVFDPKRLPSPKKIELQIIPNFRNCLLESVKLDVNKPSSIQRLNWQAVIGLLEEMYSDKYGEGQPYFTRTYNDEYGHETNSLTWKNNNSVIVFERSYSTKRQNREYVKDYLNGVYISYYDSLILARKDSIQIEQKNKDLEIQQRNYQESKEKI